MSEEEYSTDEEFLEDIKKCDEITLYFMIDVIGGHLWRMNHDIADGRVESTEDIQKDLKNMRWRIEHAVDQTTRFGVDALVRNEKGKANDSYWKWFKYWDKWKKKLSTEDWDEFNEAYADGEYKDMLPDSDGWKE